MTAIRVTCRSGIVVLDATASIRVIDQHNTWHPKRAEALAVGDILEARGKVIAVASLTERV